MKGMVVTMKYPNLFTPLEIGGAVLCEKDVPFKKRLHEYINRQINRINSAGIEIRTNTALEAKLAGEIGADVIIAAMGAAFTMPDIPGVKGVNANLEAWTIANRI